MMDLLAIVPYYTAYLCRALQQEGVDVEVGSISYYLDQDCFRSRGLKPSPGLLNLVGRFPALPARVRRVAKLVEAVLNLLALTVRFLIHPPNVLHVQFLGMLRLPLALDWLFVRVIRRRGALLVLTVHDILPHDTGSTFYTQYASVYASADRLICHSESIRQRLRQEFRIDGQKITVIPHGPFFYDLPSHGDEEVRKRYRVPAEHKIVLWQGILLPYKGLDVLLEAWSVVEKLHELSSLLVTGTGPADLVDAMRKRAAELKLQRVIFDFRFVSASELVSLHRAASLVTYPYRAITTSGALATGLALGEAIVASDLPVFRELLTDRKDALLVPPGDSNALGRAIVSLLNDDALRNLLAQNVAQRDFGAESWRAIAQDTVRVYATARGSKQTEA